MKNPSSIPSRTFLILTVAFVTALMVSNLIAGKLISVGGLVLPAAVVLFPLTYIFGDVFTEVYGFRSPPSSSQRNTRCVASSGKYFLVIGW